MSDTNLGVSPAAIAAIDVMIDAMEKHPKRLEAAISNLEETFAQTRGGLGPHEDEIKSLLKDLGVECDSAKRLVYKMTNTLVTERIFRNGILEEDPYRGGRSR